MTDEHFKKTFSRNLTYFLTLSNKEPVDLVNDLGLPFSTVSSWCNGLKLPRMGNVELLANYFKIEKSDLLEDKKEKKDSNYYINDEARDLAQFLYENPDYKVLFDASRNVKKDDIEFVKKMLDKFKEQER